jgi:hypothetical protein
MAAAQIRTQGGAPNAAELQRAYQITGYAHGSARSLLAGYNSLGQARGRGAPSDEQQDLLRAMLLFAGAGLDACAQQVVRDTLPKIVATHRDARKALTGFAARQLRKSEETDIGGIDAGVLASLLLGDAEEELIERLIGELTGSSMQSVEELKRVAAHLGVINSARLNQAIEAVGDPFGVRNRIAHDMDIKFGQPNPRNRLVRRRSDMVRDANLLLVAAEELILAVDSEMS